MVQANQPNVTRIQMRQAAGFLQQLGPSVAGYPGILAPPSPLWSPSFANGPPSFAAQTAAARTRVDKAPYKPWHSQNPSLLIRSHAVGLRASTEAEISMA